MKNLSKGLFLLSAFSLCMASCSDDAPWGGSDSEGGISLRFTSDARVMRQSRADDGVSPVVPDASRFAVKLAKSDNSYSKEWSGIEGFNKEKAFPIGDYTLTASFGDIDQEGFENPYFMGSSDVHVSPGAVTNVNVVATLANSMVSVRYTDEFKSNFPAYSAAIQTSGHDWLIFAQQEDRPAYVSPSEEVKLKLTLINSSNQRVDIQPASFTAVARHHYVVTIGVQNGTGSGDLALDVQFDDDVVAETVEVPLGDELFTAPAPTLSAKGFDPEAAIDMFEYAEQPAQREFQAFAFGKLRSATLTVVSNNYTPIFGKSVELVGADDLLQKQLSESGVVCSGFFHKVDKMGVVNVTKFIENLPAGDYKLSLSVVDALTRTSEPLELRATVKPVLMEISTVENVGFMAAEVKVRVSTNCQDIKNKVKFQVPDARNNMVDAVIKGVETPSEPAAARTRAEMPYQFIYTLALEPQIRDNIEVNAKVGRKSATLRVPMSEPQYTITADAFARKVMIKVEAEDEATRSAIIDHIAWYNGGTDTSNAIPSSNISMDADGIITIIGLNPATEYSGVKAAIGSFVKSVPTFTTETETDVPNGDFLISGTSYSFEKLNVGGTWKVSPRSYQWDVNLSFSDPQDWATVNANTCYAGSSNKNTWFMVPSTMMSSGAALIRSVGYNHAGETPKSSGGSFNSTYYCENVPSDEQLQKAAGELFLGSYSFDASESRVDGINFNSRPSSLSFQYSYAPVGDEQAEVYVQIYDKDGVKIAGKVEYLKAVSSMIDYTIDMSGYPFGHKATKLVLGFKSTKSGVTPRVNIPSSGSLKEASSVNLLSFSKASDGSYHKSLETNKYHALATGSVLTIDNVRLGYEASSVANPNASKHRANRK